MDLCAEPLQSVQFIIAGGARGWRCVIKGNSTTLSFHACGDYEICQTVGSAFAQSGVLNKNKSKAILIRPKRCAQATFCLFSSLLSLHSLCLRFSPAPTVLLGHLMSSLETRIDTHQLFITEKLRLRLRLRVRLLSTVIKMISIHYKKGRRESSLKDPKS